MHPFWMSSLPPSAVGPSRDIITATGAAVLDVGRAACAPYLSVRVDVDMHRRPQHPQSLLANSRACEAWRSSLRLSQCLHCLYLTYVLLEWC